MQCIDQQAGSNPNTGANDHVDRYRGTRSQITKEQCIDLVKKWFSLQITPQAMNEIIDLQKYPDRTLILKGKLQSSSPEEDPEEQLFVLKVFNSVTTKNKHLLNVFIDVLLFLSSREIRCPVPQMSSFGSETVYFRMFEPNVNRESIKVMTCRDYEREVSEGVDTNNVFAAVLFSFVHGELLPDIEWTKEVLMSFGSTIARLHKSLKEYSQANSWISETELQFANHPWIITKIPETIAKYSYAINHPQRETIVQEVANRYQREVIDNIQQLDQQLIHTDLSLNNVIVQQNGSDIDIQFIDFIGMQYSYRMLDVGVAVGHLMMEACQKNFDVIQAVGHLIEGYQSVFPLTDLEIDMLLVTAQARICQTLVLVCHQNLFTKTSYRTDGGWKVLENHQLVPEEKILKQWKNVGKNEVH